MSQTFTQLTSHLWLTRSRLYRTNSGVFISGGQACLIDPGIYPDEIEGIARFVAERGAAARTIVLTHSHWDHVLGPERFPGVEVTAHGNYSIQVNERGFDILKSIVAWEAEGDIRRDEPFAFPQPARTFDETATLEVGDLTLRLTHAPGHSPDQLTVYHEDSATLWAADMLSDLEIPFVSHSLAAYMRTLAPLTGWDIRVLVSGHGHAASDPQEIHRRISEDRAYLSELHDKVERAVRQGKTMEETVALCEGMSFRNPTENRGPHRWNVESAYVELGGKSDESRVGWDRE